MSRSSIVRRLADKAEALAERARDWEENHPQITQISVKEADIKRTIQEAGSRCVTCDLPCHGSNIPEKYNHDKEIVNVFNYGIIVDGWDSGREDEGGSLYLGSLCDLTNKKICIVGDENLKRSVER